MRLGIAHPFGSAPFSDPAAPYSRSLLLCHSHNIQVSRVCLYLCWSVVAAVAVSSGGGVRPFLPILWLP